MNRYTQYQKGGCGDYERHLGEQGEHHEMMEEQRGGGCGINPLSNYCKQRPGDDDAFCVKGLKRCQKKPNSGAPKARMSAKRTAALKKAHLGARKANIANWTGMEPAFDIEQQWGGHHGMMEEQRGGGCGINPLSNYCKQRPGDDDAFCVKGLKRCQKKPNSGAPKARMSAKRTAALEKAHLGARKANIANWTGMEPAFDIEQQWGGHYGMMEEQRGSGCGINPLSNYCKQRPGDDDAFCVKGPKRCQKKPNSGAPKARMSAKRTAALKKAHLGARKANIANWTGMEPAFDIEQQWGGHHEMMEEQRGSGCGINPLSNYCKQRPGDDDAFCVKGPKRCQKKPNSGAPKARMSAKRTAALKKAHLGARKANITNWTGMEPAFDIEQQWGMGWY